MSDFEAMLQRKREEQSRKRKRKDIDIINDNDDIIAQLLADMRNAAEVSNFYEQVDGHHFVNNNRKKKFQL